MADEEMLLLLEAYRNGDQQAAQEIFNRYVDRLVALARSRLSNQLRQRIDAEDVVQSVYRSFFTRARQGQYDLRGGGSMWSLLAAITINKILKKAEFHGAEKRRMDAEISIGGESRSFSLPPDAIARDPSPDEAVALAEELEVVMRELNPAHRNMLMLRLQGESIESIAKEMQVTERQVRRTLQKVELLLESRLA